MLKFLNSPKFTIPQQGHEGGEIEEVTNYYSEVFFHLLYLIPFKSCNLFATLLVSSISTIRSQFFPIFLRLGASFPIRLTPRNSKTFRMINLLANDCSFHTLLDNELQINVLCPLVYIYPFPVHFNLTISSDFTFVPLFNSQTFALETLPRGETHVK